MNRAGAVPEHGSRFGYFLTGYGILVFLLLLVPFERAYWFDVLRLLAVVAGFAAWGLWRVMQGFREARLIEDTPTSRIRSAAQGFVELVGAAQGQPGICAVGGMPALWCDYTVTERRLFEKNTKTVASHFGVEPFELRDDQGDVCAIHPANARVVTQEYVWLDSSATPDRVPPAPARFLSRLLFGLVHALPAAAAFPIFLLAYWLVDGLFNVSMSGFGTLFVLVWIGGLFLGRYRCRVRVIRPDDRIYALGHFSSDAPDARGRVSHSLRAPPAADRPYLLSTLSPEKLASQRRRQALPFIGVFAISAALLVVVFPLAQDPGKRAAAAPPPATMALPPPAEPAPVRVASVAPQEAPAPVPAAAAAAPPASECLLDSAPMPHLRCGMWSWILPRADNAAWPMPAAWSVGAGPATRIAANGLTLDCFEARAEGRLPAGEAGAWPAVVLVRRNGQDGVPDVAAIYDADASCLSIELAGDAFRLRLSDASRRTLGREFADLGWSSLGSSLE